MIGGSDLSIVLLCTALSLVLKFLGFVVIELCACLMLPYAFLSFSPCLSIRLILCLLASSSRVLQHIDLTALITSLHVSPGRVFFLDISDDVAVERLSLRMTDPVSGERLVDSYCFEMVSSHRSTQHLR